jgi:hypothetical protein
MQRIDVLVPRGMKVDVRVSVVDGFKKPVIKQSEQSRTARIPEVGRFVRQYLPDLIHSLDGNYDNLPLQINDIRWLVIDQGYTDTEVKHEVTQTLVSASGAIEAKKQVRDHISELLVPLAA